MFLGLALLTLAGSARAQNEAAPPVIPDTAPPALDANGNPVAAPEAAPAPAPVAAPVAAGYALGSLVLPAGVFQATVPVVLNLSKDAVLKPVWIPLNLSYGVTDKLTVFLNHSTPNGAVAAGSGVCIGGKDRKCDKFYNNLNLGAQFSLLKDNGIELTGIGALQFATLDPMWLKIDLGVGFKYVSAPVSVTVSPQIAIGATKRSDGNKEDLSVPLTVAFQASSQLAIFLDSGIFGPTKDFGKNYMVPVGIGAAFAVQPGLDVGAEFIFPMLVRGSNYKDLGVGGADWRYLGLFVSYRTN
jgi:hypothetical protein